MKKSIILEGVVGILGVLGWAVGSLASKESDKERNEAIQRTMDEKWKELQASNQVNAVPVQEEVIEEFVIDEQDVNTDNIQ